MKISGLQENIKNSLYLVNHIAGKNANLPILSNVKIEVNDNNILLTTTDLEVGITTNIRGKVEEPGVFTVDAKLVSDFIALLPNNKVDIKTGEHNDLNIKSDNYKTTIKGQPADDFPLIPEVPREEYFKVKTEDFRRALAQVVIAVSTSETRIELSGVFMEFSEKKMVLAATDSYRLAEMSLKTSGNIKEKTKVIIPARTLQEIVRILSAIKTEDLSRGSEELTFYITDNQILFKAGNTEVVSRLIEGQYPDYKQIIPENIKTTVVINRLELVRAIKAASLFSKSGVDDINLDFPLGRKKAIITSTSGYTGENVTELDAEITGNDNGIVVNYRYLLDGVNNIDSESIKIEIIDSNTPCILRPEKGEYLYIIMPIKQ